MAEEQVSSIWYPDLETLADGLYADAFPNDARATDHEVKFGEASALFSDLDLEFVLAHDPNQPTDPRERTHVYLSKLAGVAKRMLEMNGAAHFDRHDLPQIFPGQEHVGTPLKYSDVVIERVGKQFDNDGVLLTYFGGGYAGNHLPNVEDTAASVKILNGFNLSILANDSLANQHVLPMKELTGALVEAGFGADLFHEADRGTVERHFAPLYVPRTEFVSIHGDTFIFNAPATESGVSSYGLKSQDGLPIPGKLGIVVHAGITLKHVRHEDEKGKATYLYAVLPEHSVTDEGVVAYGRLPSEDGEVVAASLTIPKEAESVSSNDAVVQSMLKATSDITALLVGY
jgi:hypothetical protein